MRVIPSRPKKADYTSDFYYYSDMSEYWMGWAARLFGLAAVLWTISLVMKVMLLFV